MAHYVERIWDPTDGETYGLSRKDRARGVYQAFVPDELGTELPALGAEANERAQEALVALTRADERLGEHGAFLAHLLVRSESISSSWIEGNRVTPKKLAIAESLNQGTKTARDVIANVTATEAAIAELADVTQPITVGDIEDLQHVIEPGLARGIRQAQVFVGGTGYSPLRADFVAPPEWEVPRLLADLAQFVTGTSGNPVVRAAIAHAQFETIHPFEDGNGRTGRALIHTVLRRCGATSHILIPISTVFAGNTNEYIHGLTSYREIPPNLDAWVIGFCEAMVLASDNAVRLAQGVRHLLTELEDRLIAYRASKGTNPARPRKDAAVLKILKNLPAQPVLTLQSVAEGYGVSKVAASKALIELSDADVLKRVKDHRGKVYGYTADEILGLVALTERSNRVGAADTHDVKPKRAPAPPEVEHVGRLSRFTVPPELPDHTG